MWCSLLAGVLSPVLLSSAQADLAVEPRQGERFVTHYLEVKGLPDGMVLVVADEGDSVSAVRSITADGTHRLASGDALRGAGMSSPKLWAMSAEQHASWRSAAAEVVAGQERACREEGKGCAHISRFTPSYPAPGPRVYSQGTAHDLHGLP